MAPFATLPDLCLLAIFRVLPPADQLTTRNVCTRWSQLTLEVTQARRSLILLIGEPRPRHFDVAIRRWSTISNYRKVDNQLLAMIHYLRSITTAQINHLTSTFPQVRELTLCIGTTNLNASILLSIFPLFDRWGHQLTTLKLFEDDWNGTIRSSANEQHFHQLFNAINSLQSLMHLTLHLRGCPILPLPILATRLQTISCYTTKNYSGHLMRQLRQYARECENLVSISYASGSQKVDLHTLPELIRNKFTWIDMWEIQHSLPLITAHFPNLVSLCLTPTAATLVRLLPHLSQLKKLEYLRLQVDFRILDSANDELTLASVPSVTNLRLDLYLRSHEDLALLKLDSTLPNVEVIYIAFDYFCNCSLCAIDFFCVNPEDRHVIQSCLKEILAPLKQNCTKLRQITYNREMTLGTAEEILA